MVARYLPNAYSNNPSLVVIIFFVSHTLLGITVAICSELDYGNFETSPRTVLMSWSDL